MLGFGPLRVEIDTKDVQRRLGALRGDMPTVVRNAVNDVAFGVQKELRALLVRTFPTASPSTARNIFVRKADKQYLYANVFFDQLYQKGWKVDEYMMPLIEGGGRAKKPSEVRMGRYWVPANKSNPGLLNKYGNMPGGKVQQILSRMGLFNEGGYESNARPLATRKNKWYGAKKQTEYVMLPHSRGQLKAGVYQRFVRPEDTAHKAIQRKASGLVQYGASAGRIKRDPRTGRIIGKQLLSQKFANRSVIKARGLRPVMLFVNQPKYKAMFPFFAVGQQYIDKHLPEKINTEIGWAIKRHFKKAGL